MVGLCGVPAHNLWEVKWCLRCADALVWCRVNPVRVLVLQLFLHTYIINPLTNVAEPIAKRPVRVRRWCREPLPLLYRQRNASRFGNNSRIYELWTGGALRARMRSRRAALALEVLG